MTTKTGKDAEKLNKKELASLQMRNKILNTTIEILGNEGYAKVTASNLSRTAGVSKGALYHHFANLDEIKFAALAVLVEQMMEIDDPSRFENLENFLETTGEMIFTSMVEYPVAIKALYVFITRAFVDDVVKGQMQTLVNHALNQYQQVIQYFCPELAEEELEGLVRIIDTYIGGATLQWYIIDDPAVCRAGWQQFSRLILQYLEVKEK